MNNLRYFILFVFCVVLTSCEDDKTEYSDVPEISIVSVTPIIATEFQDDIKFAISYLDGNGDLGENDPDVKNLFVIDNRINLKQAFRIPQLSPAGSNISIQGVLNVVLPGLGITNGSNQQNATFSIYMVDRAGNPSNIVTSQPVTIKKP